MNPVFSISRASSPYTWAHVASNSKQAFVYVKMGPAIAFGLIHPPVAELWRGTLVAVGDGHVGGLMGLSANLSIVYPTMRSGVSR